MRRSTKAALLPSLFLVAGFLFAETPKERNSDREFDEGDKAQKRFVLEPRPLPTFREWEMARHDRIRWEREEEQREKPEDDRERTTERKARLDRELVELWEELDRRSKAEQARFASDCQSKLAEANVQLTELSIEIGRS